MQSLTGQFDRQFAAAAVGGIAYHRMIHVRAMHPDLMGATGNQLETQQRIIAEALLKTPVCAGIPSVVATDNRIFLAVVILSYDEELADFAGVSVFQDGRVLDYSTSISEARNDYLMKNHPDFYQRLEAAREEGDEWDLMEEEPWEAAQENLSELLEKVDSQIKQRVLGGEGESLDETIQSNKDEMEAINKALAAMAR